MISLRDGVVFAAGAEFFHSLGHFILWGSGQTMTMMGITVTPTLNLWNVIANGVITIILLGWAYSLSIKPEASSPKVQSTTASLPKQPPQAAGLQISVKPKPLAKIKAKAKPLVKVKAKTTKPKRKK